MGSDICIRSRVFKSPIIIAECGNNHEGDLVCAHEMLEAAALAKADMVKFQAGTPEGFARTPDKIDFYKIAGRQCENNQLIKEYDLETTFLSVPDWRLTKWSKIDKAQILHVVPEYPTIDPRFDRIAELKKHFGRDIGYSDHTIGIEACLYAAFVLDCHIIEKHFTLDKNTKGIRDHILSADPKELERLVRRIKE